MMCSTQAAFIFFCENHSKSRDEVSDNRGPLLDEAFSQAASFLQLEPHGARLPEKREVVAIAHRLLEQRARQRPLHRAGAQEEIVPQAFGAAVGAHGHTPSTRSTVICGRTNSAARPHD